MNTQEDHQNEFDSQLRERCVNSDELEDKTDKKEAEAKIKYYEQMYLV